LLSALSGASQAEVRKALVIGNSAYEAAGRLANPAHDATDLAASLRRLGFEVTLKLDLDVRSFDSAVDAFVQDAQNADLAVFFYAGHGLQYEGGAFLVPTDSRMETESAIRRETLSAQEIVSKLENASRVSVVVLDACRSNPLAEQLRRVMIGQKRSSSSVGRGLGFSESLRGRTLIIYSTAPGKEASDGFGRNSPFTNALVKHVETSGLEIEQMFKRVTAEVSKATQGQQVPVRLSALTTEIWLKPGALAASGENSHSPIIDVIAPPPLPAPQPQPPQERHSVSLIQEMLIWTGFYDGFITGTMTDRTSRAVRKFQASINSAPTGELDERELKNLIALGNQKKNAVGFAQEFDAKTGITLGLPTKLLSGTKRTTWGTNWVSNDDTIDVDTLLITDGRSLDDFYEKLKSQKGRVITYYYPQPHSFVLAGRNADGKSFYVRAISENGQIQGFSAVYSADLFPVVIAMSSSFRPAL
jgi:hypothetical protein